MPGVQLWAWDGTNDKWIPLQVDANGLLKVDMSNVNLGDLADVSVASPTNGYVIYWDDATSLWKAKKLDGSNLSQTFGASATRLRNLIIEPIAGEILRIANGAAGPFSAVINGTPSATSVVYDGEANENMVNGLASGAAQWGRIILHNTDKGNSRKMVSVNLGTKAIATESSTDDWADDDVITVQSQTNANVGYFDVDVSAEVPATANAILVFVLIYDNEGNLDTNRYMTIHPYEAYNAGKRQYLHAAQANDRGEALFMIKVIDQKVTMEFESGCVDVGIITSVKGIAEYADT